VYKSSSSISASLQGGTATQSCLAKKWQGMIKVKGKKLREKCLLPVKCIKIILCILMFLDPVRKTTKSHHGSPDKASWP